MNSPALQVRCSLNTPYIYLIILGNRRADTASEEGKITRWLVLSSASCRIEEFTPLHDQILEEHNSYNSHKTSWRILTSSDRTFASAVTLKIGVELEDLGSMNGQVRVWKRHLSDDNTRTWIIDGAASARTSIRSESFASCGELAAYLLWKKENAGMDECSVWILDTIHRIHERLPFPETSSKGGSEALHIVQAAPAADMIAAANESAVYVWLLAGGISGRVEPYEFCLKPPGCSSTIDKIAFTGDIKQFLDVKFADGMIQTLEASANKVNVQGLGEDWPLSDEEKDDPWARISWKLGEDPYRVQWYRPASNKFAPSGIRTRRLVYPQTVEICVPMDRWGDKED